MNEPFIRIRPAKGWKALNLRQLWQFRELLLTLGSRDITLRYRQTVLGVFWVVAQPLMAAGIFTFVFGRVARLPSDGMPYFVFAYAGLLGWNAFSNTLTRVSSSLVNNAHLIAKIYFPRMILPFSTLCSTLLDFIVALAMMLVLMVVYHVPFGPRLLLLPFWVLLLEMGAVGVGLYVSALVVSYRDMTYILPVATQMLLYASPVAYGVSAVPEKMLVFYHLNPLSGILEGFRWSLLNVGTLTPGPIIYSTLVSIVCLVAGAYGFKRMERAFSDVI